LRNNRCTVIFCIPGQTFSINFLRKWSRLLQWCEQNAVNYGCSFEYDPIIYNARNRCLKGEVEKGKKQMPFDGKIDYDYTMWIDSDILFEPEDFQRLLSNQKDIVSGLYLMENGKEFATANPWRVEESEKIQRSIHLAHKDIEKIDGLLEVP
jgi:hypothetical protein